MDDTSRQHSPHESQNDERLSASDDQRNDILPFSVNRELSLINLITAGIILSYVSGYLIHSISVKNMLYYSHSLIKAEYLEIGIVFLVLSAALVILPLAIYFLIDGLHDEDKRNSYERKIGITLFSTINFCYTLIGSALFMTDHEWRSEFIIGNVRHSFYDLFNYYLFIIIGIILFMGGLGIIHRSLTKMGIHVIDRLTVALRSIVRYTLLIIVLIFDGIVLWRFEWIRSTFFYAKYYFMVLVVLSGIILFISIRLKQMKVPKNRHLMILVGIIFIAILMYLLIISYEYSIYRILPSNRGGKHPLAQVKLVLKKPASNQLSEIIERTSGDERTSISLFIYEETEDFLHLVKPYPLFSSPIGTVYSIKKDDIVNMKFTRNMQRQ